MPPQTRKTPLAPDTQQTPLPIDTSEALDPVDDPLPGDEDEDHPEPQSPNLAETLTLINKELRQRGHHSGAKVNPPDTFDGSDARKLNNFILMCTLYFRSQSTHYDDASKVTFALSYLRGLALDYFEPLLLDPDNEPEWLEDWSTFVDKLRTQFGPIDPAADAEDALDHLRMKDNQHIVKYNVEFNRLAIKTGWDNNVLRHRYYTGLAERIKDQMGHVGKPSSFDELKKLAHSIDSRHWERQREKSRSDKPTPAKSDNSAQKTTTSHSNHNHHAKQKAQPSTSDANKSKSTTPATTTNSAKSAISDKLKDGKLTSQERQRRMDNDLCMYCGGVGHKAHECKKSSSSAAKAKGRAAQTTEAAPAQGKA